MNYKEEIKEAKGFSNKIKKMAPISLITGLDTIFFKKELNNIATSYINDSHLIQNLKLKNSKLFTSNLNHSKNKTNLHKSSNPTLFIKKFSERQKKELSISINRKNLINQTKKRVENKISSYSQKNSTQNSLNKYKKNIKKKNNNNRLKTSSNYLGLQYINIRSKLILSKQKNQYNKKKTSSEKSLNLNYNSNILKNLKNFSNNTKRNVIKKSIENSLKNSFALQKEKKSQSKKKKSSKENIISQNYIERKNMFKMYFQRNNKNSHLQLKINFNECPYFDKLKRKKYERLKTFNNEKKKNNSVYKVPIKAKTQRENKNIEFINKNSIKRKHNNLKKFSFTKNNNKIIEKINDSLNNSKRDSLNNINKVLFQNDILDGKFDDEINEKDQLNSVIKRLNFEEIKKSENNIFSILKNDIYESYINNFIKNYEKGIQTQKSFYIKKTPSTIEESIKGNSSHRNLLYKNLYTIK